MGQEETLCKWCNKPTQMPGDKECDGCWEVTSRIESFLTSREARDMVRKILEEYK